MEDNTENIDNTNEDPPMDDYGIDQDRILEICEKVIETMHEKYVINNTPPSSASEFRDIAESLKSIWGLTKDILNLDDVIIAAMGFHQNKDIDDEEIDNEDQNEDEG